jgi:hypothetical protein
MALLMIAACSLLDCESSITDLLRNPDRKSAAHCLIKTALRVSQHLVSNARTRMHNNNCLRHVLAWLAS